MLLVSEENTGQVSVTTDCGASPLGNLEGMNKTGTVRIGDYVFTYEDFFGIVEYVMENTDLRENDFRISILEQFKSAKIVDGWNKGNKRIYIGAYGWKK